MLPEDYNYRPLPIGTTIKKSKIEGLGLYTLMDLEKNQDLGISHVVNKDFKNNLIRTPLGGFINHSKTPNAAIVKKGEYYHLVALIDLPKNTELTCDYFESDCALQKENG